MRVRCPARHHDSQHTQRGNPEHEENPDIQVCYCMSRTEGDDNIDSKRCAQNDQRRNPEDELVGFGGDDVFLGHQLDGVGDRLQQAMRTDAHGSKPNLKVRESCALQPVHRHYGNRDAAKNQHDIDKGPKPIACLPGRRIAAEIGGDVIEHQRSTSPRTMSSVPITAMTSATRAPRTIISSACRLTKDGGLTRTRYGCVDPSLTIKYPSSPLGASIEW